MIQAIKGSIDDIKCLITESESLCMALINNNMSYLINLITDKIYVSLIENHELFVEI